MVIHDNDIIFRLLNCPFHYPLTMNHVLTSAATQMFWFFAETKVFFSHSDTSGGYLLRLLSNSFADSLLKSCISARTCIALPMTMAAWALLGLFALTTWSNARIITSCSCVAIEFPSSETFLSTNKSLKKFMLIFICFVPWHFQLSKLLKLKEIFLLVSKNPASLSRFLSFSFRFNFCSLATMLNSSFAYPDL